MHLVILLFALFASLFTLQKSTLNYCEPFFLVGFRMTFAGILLISYLGLKKPHSFKFTLNSIIALVILAIFNIYLTNIFEIWAIQHMISSKACLIYSLSPFISSLIAFIVLKETLTNKKWLGMLIGFFGLLPVMFTETQSEVATGTIAIFSMAELAIVGAVFCSVYGWIMLKKIIDQYDYSPLMANGISMLIGGILALGHSYLSGESWQPLPVSNYKPFIINSIIMCIISNIICYNLYGFLLKRFTATFMSFSGLITPLFASFFGYMWLGEHISWHFFLSLALFCCGLFIFYQQEIKQGTAFKESV